MFAMKLKHLLILVLSFIACSALAQQSTASLQSVAEDIFNKAKTYSLYRKEIDWDELHGRVFRTPVTTETELENNVRLVFEAIKDKHAILLRNGKRVVYTKLPASFVVRQELKNVPGTRSSTLSAKMIDEDLAYIVVPSTSKNDAYTLQSYQDQICALGLKNLKGIVLDLRLNEGGSIYPLAALSQLYDGEIIGHTSGVNGLSGTLKVKNGKFYQNDKLISMVKSKCAAPKNLKIAVLISQITASSGEIIASAFKGRSQTIFIGENTFGLTTLNAEFKLPGSYYLGLSTAYIADRDSNVYRNHISPDIQTITGDNFTDLSKDLKVKAAIEWIRKSP